MQNNASCHFISPSFYLYTVEHRLFVSGLFAIEFLKKNIISSLQKTTIYPSQLQRKEKGSTVRRLKVSDIFIGLLGVLWTTDWPRNTEQCGRKVMNKVKVKTKLLRLRHGNIFLVNTRNDFAPRRQIVSILIRKRRRNTIDKKKKNSFKERTI